MNDNRLPQPQSTFYSIGIQSSLFLHRVRTQAMRRTNSLLPLIVLTLICGRASAHQAANPALSAADLFKRVSPSVFVVLSLNASGRPVEQGSAVSIGKDLLETNFHVIKDGVSFEIRQGPKEWPATLVATNPARDIAELKVENLVAPTVPTRPFSSLAVGEHVYAIGAPEGLELTLSDGLISSLRQNGKDRIIQTSAAISPGSSGGGIFDATGSLVGITVAYLKEGQNLNFALPTDYISSVRSTAEWAGLGAAAYQAGQKYDGAVEYDLAAPSSYGGWAIMSVARPGKKSLALRSYKEAAADYQESVRLDSQNEEVWSQLGRALEAIGADSIPARFGETYQQAIAAYKEAVRLRPEDERAWLDLGTAYRLQSGHTKEATSAFETALRLDAKSFDAWERLGSVYTDLGKQEQALTAFDTARTLIKTNDEKAWKLLGVYYLNINSEHPSSELLERASECEERALKITTADAEAWFDLGVVYADKNDRTDVMRVYQKLKILDRQLADYFSQEAVLPTQQ